MKLEKILMNLYHNSIEKKIYLKQKEKELTRTKLIQEDLIKEKCFKEAEYLQARKKLYQSLASLSRERNLESNILTVDLKQENKETIIENLKMTEFEDELKLLKIQHDQYKQKVQKLVTEISELKSNTKEIKHKAQSSWDEWNYRKKAFETPSMEEIYDQKPKENR